MAETGDVGSRVVLVADMPEMASLVEGVLAEQPSSRGRVRQEGVDRERIVGVRRVEQRPQKGGGAGRVASGAERRGGHQAEAVGNHRTAGCCRRRASTCSFYKKIFFFCRNLYRICLLVVTWYASVGW